MNSTGKSHKAVYTGAWSSAPSSSRLRLIRLAIISGRVTDSRRCPQRGGGLHRKQLTNVETKVALTTGFYTAGFRRTTYQDQRYRIEALRSCLTLQLGQVLNHDFTFEVGHITETVNVSTGAPLLNTESGELGNVISHEPVVQLPLNGRNFSQLALLVPGVNSGSVGGVRATGGGNETQRAGTSITANSAAASISHDQWFQNVDQSVGTAKVLPEPEDIQEFKVQVGNPTRSPPGAVVNAATRSATTASTAPP
jgi:hypothetical protein